MVAAIVTGGSARRPPARFSTDRFDVSARPAFPRGQRAKPGAAVLAFPVSAARTSEPASVCQRNEVRSLRQLTDSNCCAKELALGSLGVSLSVKRRRIYIASLFGERFKNS